MKNLLSRLNWTIRKKLILSFVLLLVVPSVLVGFLSYQSAKGEIREQLLNSASESVNTLNTIIDSTIQPIRHDAAYFAGIISEELYDGTESPDIRTKLEQYMALHPDLMSAYVGTESGLMIQAVKQDPASEDAPEQGLGDDYDPRERSWYQEAIASPGEVIITEPYESMSTGSMVVTVAAATEDETGVVGINIDLNKLAETTDEIQIGEDGFAVILDQNQNFLVHPAEDAGTKATGSYFDKQYDSESGQFAYVMDGVSKEMAFTTNETTGWKVSGIILTSEIDAATRDILITTIAVIAASLLAGFVIVFFVVRSITRPLRKLNASAIKISEGDLRERIAIHSKDEIAQVSTSFNTMADNLSELISSIDKDSEHLAASSEQLLASAEQTTSATEQVSSGLQEIASGAEMQTGNVENNALSLEEVAAGITRVANSVATVSDLTKHAAEQATDGGNTVKRSVKQMQGIVSSVEASNQKIQSLQERSKEIGSIVEVISGIADETNLLALNAAIEAARAGEEGKGFAVVADEVRGLAEQSRESAKQISTLIKSIQQDTESSAEVMQHAARSVEDGLASSNETSEKFNQIINSVYEISPKMEDVASISEQIAASIQEVTASANELAVIAKQNSAASSEMANTTEEQLASMEEITAAANSLSSLAEDLQASLKRFKL